MTGDVKVSPPPHFVGALFLGLAIGATDTKLNREAVLKILPEQFARSAKSIVASK